MSKNNKKCHLIRAQVEIALPQIPPKIVRYHLSNLCSGFESSVLLQDRTIGLAATASLAARFPTTCGRSRSRLIPASWHRHKLAQTLWALALDACYRTAGTDRLKMQFVHVNVALHNGVDWDLGLPHQATVALASDRRSHSGQPHAISQRGERSWRSDIYRRSHFACHWTEAERRPRGLKRLVAEKRVGLLTQAGFCQNSLTVRSHSSAII